MNITTAEEALTAANHDGRALKYVPESLKTGKLVDRLQIKLDSFHGKGDVAHVFRIFKIMIRLFEHWPMAKWPWYLRVF